MSAVTDARDKASILVEALPYIRSYRGRTVVVKIGGAALDDAALSAVVADDLALLALVGIRLVVVHGGGPQVSAAMERVGLKPSFVGGLRVTDEESMTIVRQVLVGSINPDLVARLSGAGLSAVGLSGADGLLIGAAQTAGPQGEDLGRVGSVEVVRPQLIESLLDEGYTPVIASVAPDDNGAALNINADAVAGAIAANLPAAKLVYLTNVDGLYRDLGDSGSLISELKVGELQSMLPSLSEGMRPKAASAIEALKAGVDKVHILDGRVDHALLLEIFTEEGVGTQVLP
jgi:acetylglutamate kinase